MSCQSNPGFCSQFLPPLKATFIPDGINTAPFKPTDPVPPYRAAEASVHASIRELSDKLDRLEERIGPLLKPPGPPNGGDGQCNASAVPVQSEATRNLHEIAGRINIVGWRVDNWLDRLDT